MTFLYTFFIASKEIWKKPKISEASIFSWKMEKEVPKVLMCHLCVKRRKKGIKKGMCFWT